MSEIVVVIAMVIQLICGSTTTEANIGNMLPMLLLGGSSTNLNLAQSNWDEVDVKFDLGNGGYEKYGLGKGSSCRIHGNLKRVEPVEGVTITTRHYSDNNGSYEISFGPLKWEDVIEVFNG